MNQLNQCYDKTNDEDRSLALDWRDEQRRDASRRRRSRLGEVAAFAQRSRRQHRHRSLGYSREPTPTGRPQEGRHLFLRRPAALQVRRAQQPPLVLLAGRQRNGGPLRRRNRSPVCSAKKSANKISNI